MITEGHFQPRPFCFQFIYAKEALSILDLVLLMVLQLAIKQTFYSLRQSQWSAEKVPLLSQQVYVSLCAFIVALNIQKIKYEGHIV